MVELFGGVEHPMNVKEYLKTHTIVQIGCALPEHICAEIIVDDPIELITVVSNNDCYISEISWWDHTEIKQGSNIGYGGPRDPRNPETHFFAETDIRDKFNEIVSIEKYLDYLKKIKILYSEFDLFPAFEIRKRRNSPAS